MVTKVRDRVAEAQAKLAEAEGRLAEVNAEIERLEELTQKDWEDAKGFARAAAELDRLQAGRQRLTGEVEAARAAVAEAVQSQREAEIAALRDELKQLREGDGKVLAKLRAFIEAGIREHYELQTAERKIVNMLKSDYDYHERAEIPGDATLARFPARLWGIPFSLLRDERDGEMPSVAQVAAQADAMRRDTARARVGLPGVPWGR